MNNNEIIEKLKALKEILDDKDNKKLPYEWRVIVARREIGFIIDSSNNLTPNN